MKRILVVEDDPALGEGVCLALRSGETEAVLAPDLQMAGRMLAEAGTDLVILDVNLPDGSGLELLKELRRTSGIPVILLTANDLETDIVTGLELGADDYITKPFSLAVLRAR
ncbi:MAG TPA: response regulator, partial [Oscillospiraceae bacterium]|nr:response regulator [Oscillospiraceae bacterium]